MTYTVTLTRTEWCPLQFQALVKSVYVMPWECPMAMNEPASIS